jgi:hypothetical protein
MKEHFCPVEKALISYEGSCNWCGQKEWVGLTNDELTDLFYNTNLGQQSAVAQAIALLKQKNT